MNGKKLSSKASNSTTFLTAYTLKSFITQTALDKSDGLYAIPRWRSFCSRCLGLFFFLSEEFLTTKKLLQTTNSFVRSRYQTSSERPAFTQRTTQSTSRILSDCVNAKQLQFCQSHLTLFLKPAQDVCFESFPLPPAEGRDGVWTVKYSC